MKDFFAKEGYERQDDFEDDSCETRIFDEITDVESLDKQFALYYPADIARQLSDAIRRIRRESSCRKILKALEYCYNRKTERQACRLVEITPKTFRNHIPLPVRSYILRHSPRYKPFPKRRAISAVAKNTTLARDD